MLGPGPLSGPQGMTHQRCSHLSASTHQLALLTYSVRARSGWDTAVSKTPVNNETQANRRLSDADKCYNTAVDSDQEVSKGRQVDSEAGPGR